MVFRLRSGLSVHGTDYKPWTFEVAAIVFLGGKFGYGVATDH